MNKQEYDKGYKEAIEAIKKALQNGSQSGQGSSGSGDGRKMPSGMGSAPNPKQSSSNNVSGSGSESRGSGSQGVVRPEDCIGPSQTNQVPNTAGGMVDKKTGDDIAKQEGYSEEGGNDGQIAKEWKDRALKAAKTLKQQGQKGIGKGPAEFAARLESIYKPTKDWKKELKAVVGHAITPDEKRQAYANKNVLVSQSRIARTDKDKWDSMDYMVAMVDTSGSMSEKDIKACLGEVYGVALAKKPIKLVLMYFGSGVSDVLVFNSLAEFKKEMKSPRVTAGGGTDVAPCFTALATDPRFRRKMADIVMIFTDGYISQVKRNPKICKNLCWVIIDNPGFDLQYKDIRTKCVHIKKEDME